MHRKRALLIGELVGGWEYLDTVFEGLESRYGWKTVGSHGGRRRYLAATKELRDERYRPERYTITFNALRSKAPITILDSDQADVTDNIPEYLTEAIMGCLNEIGASMETLRTNVRTRISED